MILGPLRDLSLCRKLKMSYSELQELPEEVLEVWQAIFEGEEHGRRTA